MKVCNKNPETWIVNEVMESDVIMEDMVDDVVEDREEDMVEIPTTVDMDKGYIIFSSLIIVPQLRKVDYSSAAPPHHNFHDPPKSIEKGLKSQQQQNSNYKKGHVRSTRKQIQKYPFKNKNCQTFF